MSILEVKDRIPTQVLDNGAIRYGVYDENNNLLRYEYMKREDEPIEEGTPVNRALFRNLQGDLYTQDRYNITTVAQEFLPVDYMTEYSYSETTKQEDFLPKTWTSGGTMTLPSGESGEYFYSDTSSGRATVYPSQIWSIGPRPFTRLSLIIVAGISALVSKRDENPPPLK